MYYSFAFSPNFDLTQSYQNSYITILLICDIDKPKHADLFMSISIFLIPIANKYSAKKKKMFQEKVWFLLPDTEAEAGELPLLPMQQPEMAHINFQSFRFYKYCEEDSQT